MKKHGIRGKKVISIKNILTSVTQFKYLTLKDRSLTILKHFLCLYVGSIILISKLRYFIKNMILSKKQIKRHSAMTICQSGSSHNLLG
jgi:hypothetical protein